MIKKLITLFKIGRKLALSDALNIISKIYEIPISIKIFFNLLALFGKKNINQNISEEERLCKSIESMGITFIKLGQFLATRPDIIGEKLSDQLQTLQDKVPAFPKNVALSEIKKSVGEQKIITFDLFDIFKSNQSFMDRIGDTVGTLGLGEFWGKHIQSDDSNSFNNLANDNSGIQLPSETLLVCSGGNGF